MLIGRDKNQQERKDVLLARNQNFLGEELSHLIKYNRLYKIVVFLTCLLLAYFRAVITNGKEQLLSTTYSCIDGLGILQVVGNVVFYL